VSVHSLSCTAADERIIRLAMAALLSTKKATPAATDRCSRRRSRAVTALNTDDGSEQASSRAVRRAAVRWLRQGCDLCGRCPGISVTPPHPSGR
jgi:hypothetical protein